MRRNGYPLVKWFLRFQDNMASNLVDDLIIPISAEDSNKFLPAQVAGSSSVCENFIAHQMKANRCRHGLPIEKKGGYRFLHILPQLVPVIGLRENGFGQALRDEASIGFLRHLEHDFIHESSLFQEEKINKH